MRTVEIIYDDDCPNVPATRAQVLRAFAEAGQPPRWTEWERSDPGSPKYVRAYGSPTVLVDGKDVAGAEPSNGAACCRLYPDASSGVRGAPSAQAILAAIRAGKTTGAGGSSRRSGWISSMATLLGIGAALLPVGLCPACWPAYAGLFGALGFGFLLQTTYLLPITALFLLLAVGTLAFRARSRRGYGPFIVGLIASMIVLTSKFVVVSNAAMYIGITLLIAASVWNVWPRGKTDVCPACAPCGRVSDSPPMGAREVSS